MSVVGARAEAAPSPRRVGGPQSPARIIRSDEEAIAVAREIAAQIAVRAAERDRQRILPFEELDLVSQAGLWAINVPRAYGGAGVSYATVGQVFAILASADASIAQIQQNHNSAVHWLAALGTAEQKSFFLGQILRGYRFGNASSEAGGSRVDTLETQLVADGDGFLVRGRKAYATGALFAHYVTIIAADPQGQRHVAIVEAGSPGLSIIDDWDSFGQRITASGSVIADDVRVPSSHVLPLHRAYEGFPQGAVSQISHVGIDVGIADAAIRDAIDFVPKFSRAARDGGFARAVDDPLLVAQFGKLEIQLHAAEALLERAGRTIDRAIADPNDDTIAAASIAVAEAKVLANDIALRASETFFELAGTRSTVPPHAYDRHWRNARVHTLHDAVRWKYHAVGNYYLNGIKPPRHGTL
ncbi:SfnB family sulfur acquisition oxidoreductase [Bradyrhizobium sp. 2TAF24]|uniref:SfnB family sulfur acquisition oxidoreductase n=1 Tax=Bradyrhizobium sp. 2TAF24 TaxID=3233011 RepID=UPI003F93AB17